MQAKSSSMINLSDQSLRDQFFESIASDQTVNAPNRMLSARDNKNVLPSLSA